MVFCQWAVLIVSIGKKTHRGSAKGRISHSFKAEARMAPSKKLLIKKSSDLCELCASMVHTFSQ
jgi:hypothetical protein